MTPATLYTLLAALAAAPIAAVFLGTHTGREALAAQFTYLGRFIELAGMTTRGLADTLATADGRLALAIGRQFAVAVWTLVGLAARHAWLDLNLLVALTLLEATSLLVRGLKFVGFRFPPT